ncbi:GntR family transcriptional regulator [Evansella sp. AB-P1]|uniref:GntR family transcriptional regulator n=1 Tax=Evansella sp. AB-P1 TaxID=3037653 RepID=UPI00241E5D32|nr:GntR family transcriptional regulator [Evansella sp. AB-P1]MDG5787227.1 GntR family transcriptional regulator [Evansella sp. AB-P1]
MNGKEDVFQFLSNKTENVKSLREVVIESLREAIITGQFKPGDSLKERDLSKAMGISTTPIKEAFRILEHEGLIKTLPRKGTFVSELAETNIEEIQMLRGVVEGLAARLTAAKASDEQLKELEKQIEKMETLLENEEVDDLIEENTRFHKMISDAAGNSMISRVLMNISSFDKAFRRRALMENKEIKAGYSEHRKIFDAIKSRNPELSEQLLKQHILRTVTDVLKNKGV